MVTTAREAWQAAKGSRSVAYFSMEIALDPGMPTYAGGLGVLAGDTIRAAADLKVPLVAVTLLSRKGYFRQKLGSKGEQFEEPAVWPVDKYLQPVEATATVEVASRKVRLRAWLFRVVGASGFSVPVYLLDSSLEENAAPDRALTDFLYGGDLSYRLSQEIILGIGGVRMLRALGFDSLQRFHMNEGHAALLGIELLNEHVRQAGRREMTQTDVEAVRRKCVFTTHTPVSSGHDRFPLDMVHQIVGRCPTLEKPEIFCCDGLLNMTYLALNLSHYVNGVAKRHGKLAQEMFSGYHIDSITNGVHPSTWTSPSFQTLYDRFIPGWREDAASLRYAISVPRHEVWNAHLIEKQRLLSHVEQTTGIEMKSDVLTFGFARRATAYKRPDLLVRDPKMLKRIASTAGAFQVIYAGKAHPQDGTGKELIREIVRAAKELRPEIELVYLENYGLELAHLIIPGVDVWLNTPQPPLEASGTSGMKAALNGVPSASVLDGWWIEGCIEGVTGWALGDGEGTHIRSGDSTVSPQPLYEKLEQVIIPAFYRDRDRFIDMMRSSIAFNGSFFNTQRMLQQYVLRAYFE